jgi:hypothetical protein
MRRLHRCLFISLLVIISAGCGEKRVVDMESEQRGMDLVKKAGGKAFQDSESPPTVYSVNFQNSNAYDEDMKALQHFPNLKTLQLSPWIKAGTKYLDQCPRLETLEFVCTDQAILNLPELKKLKTVIALGISDVGLADLNRFPSLEWVSAHNNMAITDAGLDSLGKLPRLMNVHLHKTSATQEGAERLRKALSGANVQVN